MFMSNSISNRYLILLLILFCLNPICGIVLTTFIVLFGNEEISIKSLSLLFVMLALYMGLLNATKIPASDQVQYMNAYLLVPKQTIWESLTNIYGERYLTGGTTKEMGYGLLNIVGYYLSFGSYPLFIVEFTVFMYLLCFHSFRRLFCAIRKSNSIALSVAAAYIMCFFSQYFNLTIHLQRQEIATAVMLYGIVDYCIVEHYTWKRFLIPVFAFTLHTSLGLFLPLFCIRKLCKNKIAKKQLIIIIGCIFFLVSICVLVASSLLSSIGGDSYALERLSEAGNSTEDSFDFKFLLVFTIPLLFIVLKNIFSKLKSDYTKEYLFYIFFLALAIFYMLTPDSTMQYRYFMMSYSFWPFIIPLLYKKKSLCISMILTFVCVFLFLRFFITFENMAWHYTSVDNALTCNVVSLYLKNPF